MRDQSRKVLPFARPVLAAVVLAAVAIAVPSSSNAQQGWNAETNPSNSDKNKSRAKATKAATADEGGRSGDSQLRQRVEQLEEQLADVQVTMGTLESLGRGGGGSAAQRPAGGGGVDQARLDSLEIQLRALAAQVEELSRQMRQSERRGDAAPLAPPERHAAGMPPPQGGTVPARSGGFGDVTVTPSSGERDPIGSLLSGSAPTPQPASATLPPAAANAGSPRELYETAYGYLLQQDYGSAEVTFDEFLRRYPRDRQAADAQYWYGETLYVQRRYKPAGHAFLKVIEDHGGSSKVPHSILKLAMSLEQLGQKDCGLFTALETRHPNAPADIKTKARALKQRVGC